jgi:hypothetical protein
MFHFLFLGKGGISEIVTTPERPSVTYHLKAENMPAPKPYLKTEIIA